MKSVFNYKGIALIAWSLLLACCCTRADAQSITLTQSLSGADGSLAVDSSRTVVDSVSMYPGLFPTVADTSSMDNLVMLYVDELSIRMPPDSFKVDVEVRIYYTNRLGASDSITSTTLSVEYSQLRQYNHRAVFYFKDAQSVQVKVLSISSSTSNLPAALPFLILENRIVVNRVFEMDCVSDIVTGLSQNTDIVSTKGELGVSWSSLNAAQAYDLEWTYVDQTALDAGWFDSGGVLDADLLFRNNATRVTVAANAYNIPLLYESEGKLFYRVRGVQTAVDGERKVTRWSSDNSLGEYAFSGHEVSLNWQASTSFAEEGKRKSVVQYFDGTLRNRQTVTKDNETDTTIVAETFYDKQGRAVIQVLPSPSLSTLIKYNPLYNRDTFSLEYSKESYDTLLSAAAYCNTAAPRMDSAYGTARYYSRNNPFYSQLHDQHIPRAEGFPFTEVKYTQDNTGRILAQGGVGKPFQLDSAHATKYYYGVPEQQDLDALFGTEAGYAAHYQKNMVRDANGQYSVSYVDMHGRTVATALAGDVPSSLAALDSYSNTSAEYQLLNRNNNVVLNGSVIATKSLLVPKAGLHTFKYKLAADSLSLKDKDNADICYECLYDLTITITDDCNNQLLPGGKPYVFEANNLSVAPLPYDTSCNEVSDFDAQFSITLAEGSYVITKMLTLREDARNWYRDSLYAPHNTVSSKEDIIAEQLDKIRAQNDTSCNQPVVPWYPYEQYREQMLLDLSPPFGQYALTLDKNEFGLRSIFDKDSDGRAVYAKYNYRGVSPDPAGLNEANYINNFESSWAEFLLGFHPENGLLTEYEKYQSSYHWDADFEATDTYAAALAKGYLNPLNMTSSPANAFGSGNDSLRLISGSAAYARSALQDSLTNYKQLKDGNTYSLWVMASIAGHCDALDAGCFNGFRNTASTVFGAAMCEGEKDMAWRFFRGEYLRLKNKTIDAAVRAQVGSPVIATHAVPVFMNQQQAMALINNTNLFSLDSATAIQAGADSLNAQADRSCTNFAIRWWEQLETCNYSSADSAIIIPRLIAVCKEGADLTHPFGASSVKPSSIYAYKSFDDVISQYNNSIGKVNGPGCNAFLIDAPAPYNKPLALVDMPTYSKPDSCACEKITGLKNQYEQSSGYSSFSDYVQNKLHVTLTDADLYRLDSLCTGTISCRYITQPINLPPALQCSTGYDVCVDCNQVNTVYANFKSSYPGVIPTYADTSMQQHDNNKLFANYMNNKLGFGKTTMEYLAFMDSCGVTALSACDSLQQLVENFKYSYSSQQSLSIPDTVHFGVTRVFYDDEKILTEKYADIFKDGHAHVPADIWDVTSQGQIAIQKNDTLCVGNEFTIEGRMRGDESSHVGSQPCKTVNFIFWDQNSQVCYSPTFQMFTVPSNADCGRGTWTCELGTDTTNRHMYTRNLLDWVRIKMAFKNDTAKIYANDTLITSIHYNVPISKIRRYAVSIGNGYLDYVKVWDSTGRLAYIEEFEDCQQSPSNYPPEFACNPNCETRFANYFNQLKGTSYSFNQIDSIYANVCDESLNICGPSVSEQLGQLVEEFIESRVACVPENWSINPSQSINQWNNFITDGMTHISDSVRASNSPGLNFARSIPYAHSLTNKDFTVETRLRITRNDTSAFNPNLQFVIQTDSTYINALFWQPGKGEYWGPRLIGGAYDFQYPGHNVHVYPVPSLIQEFQDWAIFKIQVLNDSVHNVYFNNVLVLQLPFSGKINTLKYVSFFTGAFGDTEFRDINFDYIKIYDSDGNILDFVGFDCQENCNQRFENFYNEKYGTDYTYNQIDSIYTVNGLTLTVCYPDTSSVRCDQLSKFQKQFQQQYLKPSSGYVDLDMRTFAGNQTPEEGPKGVFDVNGKLLGNTVDSTPTAVKESYVKIWNRSLDNRAVGTLSLLQSGKFRLTLNPGKTAPCQGIIGQRYYQFDVNTNDTLRTLSVAIGSYIDFGDSTNAFFDDHYSDSKTSIFKSDTMGHYYASKFILGDDYVPLTRGAVVHYYTPTSEVLTRTVTVYHTDRKGLVGFADDLKYVPGAIPQYSQLRGYFPQQLFELQFTGTRDSTINTTARIKNFSSITTIQNIELDTYLTGPLFYNKFGSFANNRDLRRLRLIPLHHDLSAATVDSLGGNLFSQNFPNLSVNFPQLRFVFWGGWGPRSSDISNFKFELPKIRFFALDYQTNDPAWILDTIYNQMARAVTVDSSIFKYGYSTVNPATPTTASAAAKSYLLGRSWRIRDGVTNDSGPGETVWDVIDRDPLTMFTPFSDFINSKLGTNLTAAQVDSLYLSKCGHKPVTCINADTLRTDLLLCGKNEQLAPSLTLADIYDPPCSDSSLLAHNSGVEIFTAYKDSLDDSFNRKYNEKCLAAASVESFTVEHNVSEYHYTLYYYDQAGNLVKTIAPAGVNPNRNSTWLAQVAAKRLTGEKQVPNHIMPTVYRYNSLNQVVTQRTPDAGKSSNWYDRLGRLVVSQNAQQLIDGNYSYTLYDPLGRITEVGQKPQPTAMTQTISRSPSALETWVYDNDGSNTLGAEMVTQTTYDVPGEDATACVEALRFTQKPYTLRNRVSYTRYFEKPAYTYNGTRDRYEITGYSYTTGIDYSYDIHGNVDTMRNLYGTATYNPMPHHGNNACKTIAYTYDLISGKVNQVHYNPGQVDEFYHRYEYDAENRLLNVYVTDHKAFIGQDRLEENDASYKYYRHGPLARKVIGQEKVTGMDYAYTLQGWIKGVNSTSTRSLRDIGADGVGGTGYPNRYVGRDLWSYTLYYYQNDYEPINADMKISFPDALPHFEEENKRPLYNGNISASSFNLPLNYAGHVYSYGYDQLNRLTSMDLYWGYNSSNNDMSAIGPSNQHKERYSYDANGNILKAFRNGNDNSKLLMDNLTYSYYNNTNKLNHIRDTVGAGNTAHANNYGSAIDLKDQAANNYTYDAIGNLKSGVHRGPTNIDWNVYGKIQELTKWASAGTTAQIIHYYYDPSGNRVGQAQRMGAPGANYNYTWYVRDAQGNTLATYTVTDAGSASAGTLLLDEHYIYGSDRIGTVKYTNFSVDRLQRAVTGYSANLDDSTYLYTFTRGNKLFELTNHLGNVNVTLLDRRTPLVGTGGNVTGYNSIIYGRADYTPFGMPMVGRNSAYAGRYRYGFNGKEMDNQVWGNGNELDYGMRVYDPRVGRFLSVDPLTKKFPHYTPYQYAGNTPIQAIDLDGGEDRYFMTDVIHTWSGDAKIGKTTEDQTKRVRWYNTQFAGSEGHGTLITFRHFYESKDGHTTAVLKETQLFIPDPTWYESLVKSGDESGKVKFGYRIYGSGQKISWQKGSPTASNESESLDLGKWLDFAGGLRAAESVSDLNEKVIDFLGGVKNVDMQAVKEALDIISTQSENLNNAAEKILSVKEEINSAKEREKIIICDYCGNTYENKKNNWVPTTKEHTDSAQYHGSAPDKTVTRKKR